MRVLWTKQALEGWQQVAEYIFEEFGYKALQEFKERTLEAENLIAALPEAGAAEWTDPQSGTIFRRIIIYRKSKMLYFTVEDTIYIADFWDVRSDK